METGFEKISQRELLAERTFLSAWRNRRTGYAGRDMALYSSALTTAAWGLDLYFKMPTVVVITGFLPVMGSVISLLHTTSRPVDLGFLWWPIYLSLWIASLVLIGATGGLVSPIFLDLLVLSVATAMAFQNAIHAEWIFVFALANFSFWVVAAQFLPLQVSTPPTEFFFGMRLLIGLGVIMATYLVWRCERALSQEVVVAAERLAESRMELVQAVGANEAKAEFLRMVSHELRTPLAVLLGMVELLAEPDTSTEQRAVFIEKVQSNGLKLGKTIQSILDYVDADTRVLKVRKRRVDVDVLLRAAASGWEARAKARGIALSLDFAPNATALADTDPAIVRRILELLFDNALKFTTSGEIHVSMSVGTGSITIGLCNAGCDIDDGDHDRLFLPFSQLDASTTRSVGGLGLGLALSQSLAGLLQAEVRMVRSPAARGTIFELVLPSLHETTEHTSASD